MKKPLTIMILFTAGALFAILSFTAAGRFVWWLFLIGALLALSAAAMLVADYRSARMDTKGAAPPLINSEYAKKDAILSPPELVFYRALCEAMRGEYEIVPQAVLSAFLDKRTRTAYRNELFRIVDFVVAELGTFRPLVAIELNDSSHRRADRKLRDDKVAAILGSAGMPLLIVTPGYDYDVRELRRQLSRLL